MSITPIVLVHGALGAGPQMEPLRDAIRDALRALRPDARVHIVELAGHGVTPGDATFRIERFAEQLAGAVAAQGGAPADLFGFSMGGYAALETALRTPELVRRVATLATKFAWSAESAARESAMLDAARIREKVPRFAEALEARHTSLGWERVLASTAELMHALGAHPLLTSETLARLAHPVRVHVGDRDATVSVEESLAAVRALPAGELAVLPRTAHPLEKVRLEELARSLADFFA